MLSLCFIAKEMGPKPVNRLTIEGRHNTKGTGPGKNPVRIKSPPVKV